MTEQKKIIRDGSILGVVLLLFLLLQVYWLNGDLSSVRTRIQADTDALFLGVVQGYAQNRLVSGIGIDEHPEVYLKPLESVDTLDISRVTLNAGRDIGKAIEQATIIRSLYEDKELVETLARSLAEKAEESATAYRAFTVEAFAGDRLLGRETITLRGSLFHKRVESRYLISGEEKEYTLRLSADIGIPSEVLFSLLLLFATLILFIILASGFFRLVANLSKQEEARRAHEEYLFGLVHDLKTPLAYTQAVLDKLSSEVTLGELSKSDVETGSFRLGVLADKITELLTIPKYAHLNPDTFKTVYPADLLFSLEEEIAFAYPDKAVTFAHNGIEDQAKETLPVEQSTIILRILLDNAVKYSGRTPEVTVTLARTGKSHLRISVEDNGGGLRIKSGKRKKVITPGILRELIPDAGRGNGIGLVTAGRLAEALGGALLYERTPQGSRFSFTIPTK